MCPRMCPRPKKIGGVAFRRSEGEKGHRPPPKIQTTHAAAAAAAAWGAPPPRIESLGIVAIASILADPGRPIAPRWRCDRRKLADDAPCEPGTLEPNCTRLTPSSIPIRTRSTPHPYPVRTRLADRWPGEGRALAWLGKIIFHFLYPWN